MIRQEPDIGNTLLLDDMPEAWSYHEWTLCGGPGQTERRSLSSNQRSERASARPPRYRGGLRFRDPSARTRHVDLATMLDPAVDRERSRLCHGESRWEPVTRGKRPQEMSVLPVCEFDGPGILSATPQHSTTSPPLTSMPNRVRMYEAWCNRACNIVRFVRKMKLDPEPVPFLPFQRWCLITFSLGSCPWVA